MTGAPGDASSEAVAGAVIVGANAAVLAGSDHRDAHLTGRHDSRNGMLVHHLVNGVFQHDYELVERFDLALQFDTADEIDCDGNLFLALYIKKRVL